MTESLPQLLTTRELCAVLKVSEETAYRKGRRGVWPCYRVGADYRWSLDEVLAAMRSTAERRTLAGSSQSGPAQCDLPGPGTGGESHA